MKKRLLWLVAIPLIAIGSLTYAENDLIVHDTTGWTITVYWTWADWKIYWITIQDKNLWAENVWDTWYYFQWWNNHWNYAWTNTWNLNELLDADVNERVNKWYSWNYDKFIMFNNSNNITYDYRSWVKNPDSYTGYNATWPYNNLWWGWNDNDNNLNIVKWYDKTEHKSTNLIGRRWPCPEWYHVPSAWEWQELNILWNNIKSITSGGTSSFINDLLLPNTGIRDYITDLIIRPFWYTIYYWSSSPWGGEYPVFSLFFNGNSLIINDRAGWIPVRCFKNEYIKLPKTLNLFFMPSTGDVQEVWTWEVTENMTGAVPEKAKNLSRTGYELFWIRSGATETEIFDFETTPISWAWADESGNVYFIAQWTGIKYSVEFTWTDVSWTMANQEFTYDISQDLTPNAFTKTGYEFSGWIYWTTWYTDKQNVSNLTTTDGETVTLTAQWTPITYSIEFTWTDVSWTMLNQEFTYDISQDLTPNAFTKAGYVFSGWIYWDTWYTDKQNVSNLTTTDGETVTLTAQWTPITYTISFSWNAADATWTAPATINAEYDSGDIAPDNTFTLTGYTFTWWNTESNGSGTWYATWAELKNLTTTSGANVELYAQWEVNIHKLNFVVDWTTIQSGDVAYAAAISAPAEPKKDCNSFAGWTSSVEWLTTTGTMPDSDVIFTANWNYTCSRSSGWWGGSSRSNKTSDTQDSSTSSQNDKKTENVIQSDPEHSEWGSEESSKTPMDSSDKSSEWQEILSPSDSSFTKEQKDAYTFAHEKWITTMPTINEANMDWKLTRIAMAKMLSQYAMNVLWQKPANIVTPKFNDVTDKQNSDYDDWVSLAYQLWIMWINMPNNNFRPNDEVTRAEFATALSRMLYHTSDGEYRSTDKYYTNHMKKLVQEWIITNDDAKMKELRWYVMIMLMRSVK